MWGANYVPSNSLGWQEATDGLCFKHVAALWELDRLGYQPVYRATTERYCVLGRNTAYRFMLDLGYEWNDRYNAWQMPLPF